MILKAKAANGSLSDGRRFTSCPVFGSIPVTDSTSSGDGRKSTTPSNSCWTPLFLKADPHRIGVIFNRNHASPEWLGGSPLPLRADH